MLNMLGNPPNNTLFRRKEPTSHLALGNPRKNKPEAKAKKSERNASEFLTLDNLRRCSRVNSTKSPASVVGNISERRLVSRVWRVREVVRAYISVFLQSEWCRFQYWSADVASAI